MACQSPCLLRWLWLAVTAATVSTNAPAFLYRSDYSQDAATDFFPPLPGSLHHEPLAVSLRGTTGAMVFGAAGEHYPELHVRVNAVPGAIYEVILEVAIRGEGWVTGRMRTKLLAGNIRTLRCGLGSPNDRQ